MKCKKLKLTFGINFFKADEHLLALLEAPSELRTRFHAVRDQRGDEELISMYHVDG